MDKPLCQELYAIRKMQLAQKHLAKWNNYSVKINEHLLNNIKKFVPIDGNNCANTKLYRLTKNKISTVVFNINQNPQPGNIQIVKQMNKKIYLLI